MSSLATFSIDEQIAAVNVKIAKVEMQIDAVDDNIDQAEADGNTPKIKRLSEKEQQLREEKKQLNDRLNIFLQQQQQQQPDIANLASAIQQFQINQREAAERQEKAQQEAAEQLQQEAAARQQEFIADLSGLKTLVSGLSETVLAAAAHNPRSSPLMSPAQLGFTEIEYLRKCDQVETFVSQDGRDAILSMAEQAELSGTCDEHEMIAFLTPHLTSLFAKRDLVVVNSEELAWLRTSADSKFNQKPDMLVCHPAVYESKDATHARQHVTARRNVQFKFGVLGDWHLRDSVGAVLEGKKKIDNASFGEIINYGRLISVDLERPNMVRVVVFDVTEFCLCSFKNGEFCKVVKCTWLQPGSLQLLTNFASDLRSNWLTVLDAVCLKMKVVPVEGNSFLGYGGTGRVFRVVKLANSPSPSSLSSRNKEFALKIVLGSSLDLQLEAEHLRNAKRRQGDNDNVVMGLEGDVVEVDGGAGLLLSDIGRGIPQKSAGEFVYGVVAALVALHRRKIVHGDPRLPNIVQVGKHLQWIDFRESRFQSEVLSVYVSDMRVLAASFVQLPAGQLVGDVDAAVSNYKPCDDASIEAVCKALKLKL
jgi:hypothetical protein